MLMLVSQHESGTAQGVAKFHSLHFLWPFLVDKINIAENPCHTPVRPASVANIETVDAPSQTLERFGT
ncbi:hypothetical protein NXS19_003901 [Fusarium pseudograminearum]|nr:hypothetical protein NXS19_003901 [Fusarium pseudograminearum]